MSKAIIIVDYNNLFTSDDDPTSSEYIDRCFSSTIDYLLNSIETVDSIQLRIYGGWYQDDKLTQRASTIMQKVGKLDFFPRIKGNRRVSGYVEFVSQICGLDYVWTKTFRQSPGIPHLIINKTLDRPECASHKDACPVEILKRFTKSTKKICSIPNCNIRNETAFVYFGQKMVDTMMACDVLSFADDPDVSAVTVLTEDVDIFPAIALVTAKHPDIFCYLGVCKQKNLELYSSLLASFPITVFQI